MAYTPMVKEGVECIVSDAKRLPFAAGFEKPSAIQQRAIVPVIKGRDVIAQ